MIAPKARWKGVKAHESRRAPGLDGLYLYAGPLSLEYPLPEQTEGLRPVLEIRGLNAAAGLRLDGAPFQRLPAGSGNLYVTLPADWSGKTLTLTMEKGEEDPEPSIYLTNSVIINEQARADTSLRAFPAAIFGMIFLLTLGMKKRRKAFMPFAILPSLFYFVMAGFQTVFPLFSAAALQMPD